MNKEKFHIDMPDNISIENEIEIIVNKGLEKRNLFYSSYMMDMYKQIGFRCIFHDIWEILFAIFLVAILLVLPFINKDIWVNGKQQYIYVIIMITSPILYLVMSLIAFINTKERKTYELEMSCKYNLYQLASFRMLIFSIVAILFNLVYVFIIVNIYNQINFIRAFMISVTALFIFSILFLYMIFIMRCKYSKYFGIIIWIAINLGLSIVSIKNYIKIITTMPIPVYSMVLGGCIYVYINKLKKLIKFTTMKGEF